MRGIVIMKKNPSLLGKPRISFESQIRQLKYEQSSLPLATCFQWSLWHVSSPSPLKGFSYLNVAICIPPSQYNNRISHGSSMWNFKFNRSQQKQQQSQWSRRHLQSANLCCWWVEDYWVKSALKCGRLSLLSNWSFEKFRPYFSTIVTWHLAFCRCPLTEFEYLFKLLKPISSHSIELYFGASSS